MTITSRQFVVIRLFFIIICIAISVFMWATNLLFSNLPVLILAYGVIFWGTGLVRHSTFGPGNIFFQLACFGRYFVWPLLFLLSDQTFAGVTASAGRQFYTIAIWYMLYEMIIVAIGYALIMHYFRKKLLKQLPSTQAGYNFASGWGKLSLLLIIPGIVAIILYPSVLTNYTFFLSNWSVEDFDASAFTQSVALVVDYARIIIPIAAIIYFGRKYKNNPDPGYLLLPVFLVLISCMFFTKTSRNSIIIPAVAYLFLLSQVFWLQRKKILWVALGFILLALAFTTVNKSLSGKTEHLSLNWVVEYVSSYVMGPKEIAIGFLADEIYHPSITVSTFVNDLFSNVPLLNKYVNPMNRTGQYYNFACYSMYSSEFSGGGYIIPSAIQGLMYFGLYFGPLLTLVNLIIFCWADYRFKTNTNLLVGFFLIYISAYTGLFYSVNINLISTRVIVWLLPVLIISRLNAVRLTKPVQSFS